MSGMLHARIVRPPHYKARLNALDPAVELRLVQGGCEIVQDGSFLAVSCADEFGAVKAAENLFETSDWDLGGGLELQPTPKVPVRRFE